MRRKRTQNTKVGDRNTTTYMYSPIYPVSDMSTYAYETTILVDWYHYCVVFLLFLETLSQLNSITEQQTKDLISIKVPLFIDKLS